MPPNPRLAPSKEGTHIAFSKDSNNVEARSESRRDEKISGDPQGENEEFTESNLSHQNNVRRFGQPNQQQRPSYSNGLYGMNSGGYGMSGYGNSMASLGGYGMMGGYGMGYGMGGYGMQHGGGIMGLVTALYGLNHILMSFGQLVQIIGGNSQQIMLQIGNIRQFVIDLANSLRNPGI